MSHSIVTFGEIMLRLTPVKNHEMLVDCRQLNMDYAGAASNVAHALAKWENHSCYVTKLPANPIGEGAMARLKQAGIDTSYILRDGERMGTYFIEQGESIRSSRVTYDRKHSAFQQLTPGEIDWDHVFTNKSWFHFTGITPSLSENCAQECLKAVEIAKKKGLTISFDLNFRRKMWSDFEKAKQIYRQLLPFCDVLLGNLGSIKDVFGISSDAQKDEDKISEVGLTLQKQFNLHYIALSRRILHSATHNEWKGFLFEGEKLFQSGNYDLTIVDRFGTGDAFAAGIIHGLVNKWSADKVINFAISASALKHTTPGDLAHFSLEEVMSYVDKDKYGHIER